MSNTVIAANHKLLVHSILYLNLSKVQFWKVFIYFPKVFSDLLILD